MKKEDAKTVLEFLEYVGKNMVVKDCNIDYHTKELFDSKCILEDEVNEAGQNQGKALNLAGVSVSLLPENVTIKDLKDVHQYFRTHDKTMREHKAFATIHYLIEHIESD